MLRLTCVLVMFLAIASGAFWAEGANAGEKIALVLGNSQYEHAPILPNPRNDAEAIANALERLNFTVVKGFDLDLTATMRQIKEFSKAVDGSKIALFYYAGHAVQVGGENYLVPTDADISDQADLDFSTIRLNLVLKQMENSIGAKLILLDACRDNPFATKLARSLRTRSVSVSEGLGEVHASAGSLIAFATEPGNVASDGKGDHSPFTAALLDNIEKPGIEIEAMMRDVRREVISATQHQQVPWSNSSLTGTIVLKPGATPASSGTSEAELALAEWSRLDAANDVEAIREFGRRHAGTVLERIAQMKLASLSAVDTSITANDTAPSSSPGGTDAALEQFKLAMLPPVRSVPAPTENGEAMRPAIFLGPPNNNSAFNRLLVQGAEAFKAVTGTEYQTKTAPNETKSEDAIRELARQGYDPIIAAGFLNSGAVDKVAKQFPDTRFAIIDMVIDKPNVQSVIFNEQEGSYIVGIMAALASKSKKVGFVGGMDIPLIQKYACGFKGGAKSVGGDVEVLVDMAGMTATAFVDPKKGKLLAQSQIKRGADVIYQVAGGTGIGVLQAAADAGKLGIGVDENQNGLHPGRVLTSMIKRVDIAVYKLLMDIRNGEWKAGLKTIGAESGGIGAAVDENNQGMVTDAMREHVAAAVERIADKELKVHDFMRDNKCPY